MAITNYSNRTVDISMFGLAVYQPGIGEEQTDITLALQTGGRVCTGIAKLAQKFLLVLLSSNNYYDMAWGTELSQALLTGSVQKAYQNLSNSMGGAIANAIDLLRSQETDATPDDERVGSAQVVSMTQDTNTGSVTASIVLQSSAGNSTVLVTPVYKVV